jgi:hypothetical protein
MPRKEKFYLNAKFAPTVIKKAHSIFLEHVSEESRSGHESAFSRTTTTGHESWTFDKDEEFFSEYRKPIDSGRIEYWGDNNALECTFNGYSTQVAVRLPERHQVEEVFEVFEDAYQESILTSEQDTEQVATEKPKVFIGHGRSSLWRELSDHLTYLQGFEISAYETGPRAGFSVKEVLERLLREAHFAILIHTAEDEQADGHLRARENAVHETGLFQGSLGFRRAIVLREEGCEAFSNHTGITEVRFSKGNIKETYGEVVATLHRELPSN